MRDLYDRLKAVQIDAKYVREKILPDWWEDSLAETPFHRAYAEAAICTHLGYSHSLLSDPTAPLPRHTAVGVLFKRNRTKPVDKLLPGLHVVKQVAKLIRECASDVPQFDGRLRTATEIRATILQSGRLVDLASLVEYCWSIGIPVTRIAELPRASAAFDAVAVLRESRPVISLVSGKAGPPYLAFYLAHEVGHIARGHIPPGMDTIVDAELEDGSEGDDVEIEADRFANELLTGKPDGLKLGFTEGMSAAKLGQLAADAVRKNKVAVDPGTICLSACWSTGRWELAQGALKSLGVAAGGPEIVASYLARHLPEGSLSDSSARFMEAVCGLPTTHAV